MAPKGSPDKALAAILPLISSGQAYEAHQKARTFASRYVKARAFDTAAQVLFQAAKELLKAGHAGSGSDLGVYMIDVYHEMEQEVNDASRGNVTQLIALVGRQGTWRKVLIEKAVAWSSDFTGDPAGDPVLHYHIGELLVKEGSFELAERHFIAGGTRDCARLHATMMAKWVQSDPEPARFAIRGVLPYLLLQNILCSRIILSKFIGLLSQSRPTLLLHPPLPLPLDDEVLVTSDPALNFLQLLIRVCQRGEQSPPSSSQPLPARTAWLKLVAQYKSSSPVISEVFSNQVNTQIGQIYFGFSVRKLTTPWDMISGLLGGGDSGSPSSPRGGRGQARGSLRRTSTGPELD
ncbi:uncharacterized protein EI90DRAFT_3037413 [Cantharellus anzutake]|uniref:uncharacterized protein n=1 Tax=Cantharellus anzutake TaxID=1750568 RepID=UPI0019084F7C|nr:uncharacterized protein EI90DRAFT_3037413 [Cantharellus anzutake]KAF8339667.1 hypothetical protein EI90DRAFT_3037413 [Cantharellus anzutake]